MKLFSLPQKKAVITALSQLGSLQFLL